MATYKSDPLLTGAHIAQQQYQNNAGVPKEQDIDAELFKDIRSSLGEKPRGWRAVASGFTKGLEHNSKKGALHERKKDLDKYNKVMEYFEETSNNSIERNQWYEKQEQAKTASLPYVVSYYQNYSKYDPITQKNSLQKIADITNRITGADIQIESVDGTDGTKATAIDRKTGETVFFSLQQLFPEQIIQEEAARSLPSYQLKLQEQRQQQALENQFKQQQLGIEQEKANALKARAEKEGKPKDKGISPEEMEKNTYKRLYELLKEGDPTVSALPGANLSRKIAATIPIAGKLFEGDKLFGSGLAPQQEYQELVADLKGQKFKKYGYRNEAEFKNIKTLSPELPHDQALKFVETKLKELGVDPNNTSTVKMKSPDGKIWDIPQKDIEEAKGRGAIQVE